MVPVIYYYGYKNKQTVVIFRHNIDAWSYFIISKCT